MNEIDIDQNYVLYCTSNEKFLFVDLERKVDGDVDYVLRWSADCGDGSIFLEHQFETLFRGVRSVMDGFVHADNWYHFIAVGFIAMMENKDMADLTEIWAVPLKQFAIARKVDDVDFTRADSLFVGFSFG